MKSVKFEREPLLSDRCVPLKWVCDGDSDCAHAEDEAGCGRINVSCTIQSSYKLCKDWINNVRISLVNSEG